MKVIDLTQTFKPGMRGYQYDALKTLAKDGWNASGLHFYSHSGTHLDAPLHFDDQGLGLDRVPVDSYIADCWVIDLIGIAPRTLITKGHLGEVANHLVPGEGLLIKTAWERYCDDVDMYRDQSPRLSKEFAAWCAAAGVKMIGVEPPSVADVNNIVELATIHTILLNAGITIVEGLVNLEAISQEKVQFIALPLKIENGDGSPCRAIVIEY